MAHATTPAEDAALSLAMAMVTSSAGPLLLLDGDLNIIAASDTFFDAFQIDPTQAVGRAFSDLGEGEWNLPQVRLLLQSAAAGSAKMAAYEMDLCRTDQPDRHLVIHAQRLDYLDLANRRLTVAVSDVTDVRADALHKEKALEESLVLLHEVRHRVANSLQIVASVLLQNARRAHSEEARNDLQNAHNRVMSIAALERQLSSVNHTEVDLRVYVTALCESIGASIISDPALVRLRVTGSSGVVSARVAVSLGLIVTELVINALKHAFPEERAGQVVVDCSARGPNWEVSVCDDGVGVSKEPARGTGGLGSNIVRLLAKQLGATVTITAQDPGTCVSVRHTAVSLVDQVENDARENSGAARRRAEKES